MVISLQTTVEFMSQSPVAGGLQSAYWYLLLKGRKSVLFEQLPEQATLFSTSQGISQNPSLFESVQVSE
jgi:hypothetical protein